MATQDYAASVQGASIRVTRLNAAGALLNGPLDSYTTSAFIRTSFTPEYEDGEEITEKAADGTVCVSYKAPDRLKRVTMELAICEPDPELTALLAGGVLLTRNEGSANTPVSITSVATITTTTAVATVSAGIGSITVGSNITIAGLSAATGGSMAGIYRVTAVTPGTTGTISFTVPSTFSGVVTASSATATLRDDTSVGWAAPAIGDDPAGNGVAIEVWSHAVANGKRAATNPYFHWIFPYARLRASGDRVIENGLLANTFEGYGIGNTAFGSGPDGRWEWTEVTDRPYAYARDDWSPSLYHYKGFYTWDGSTGAATAVTNLPVAEVDTAFNVPGGEEYDSAAATDIAASDV
jgi:hypothetical protein